MFIDNTNLAELVHFQVKETEKRQQQKFMGNKFIYLIKKGYPKQLLPVLVNGVPSMHICLDFLPKLLSHNEIDKQVIN